MQICDVYGGMLLCGMWYIGMWYVDIDCWYMVIGVENVNVFVKFLVWIKNELKNQQ